MESGLAFRIIKWKSPQKVSPLNNVTGWGLVSVAWHGIPLWQDNKKGFCRARATSSDAMIGPQMLKAM